MVMVGYYILPCLPVHSLNNGSFFVVWNIVRDNYNGQILIISEGNLLISKIWILMENAHFILQ